MDPNQQSKLNILVVLGSGRWGGGEKNSVDLITGLRKYYNFATIHSPGKTINQVLESKEIEHYEFPLDETPTPKKIYNFIKLVKKLKPDLIHSHLNRANLFLSISKPWLKCKWINTVHGFTSQIYNILPDHLICVSKAIQNDLPKRFRLKSTLIYNGIEQLDIDNDILNFHQNPIHSKQNIRAIVLATIHPNKGQNFVCKALENYDSQVSIEFLGTGSQQHTDRLRQLTHLNPKLKLDDNIIHNVQKRLLQSDFVIIPSFKEALSYVAIESLSLGVPVLVSRTGGLVEVVTEGLNGYFFTPGDVTSFQEGLEKMVSEHTRLKKNLIEKPFLKSNQQFRQENMLSKVQQLYAHLCSNSPQ